MIRLDVLSNARQNFIVRADEPMRVEVGLVDGKVIAWGFLGCEDDPAQEPDVVFDGTAVEAMESMVRHGRSSDGVRAEYLG